MTDEVRSPELSVVVAHHGVDDALTDCLRAHGSELEETDELIVVLAADDAECVRLGAELERAVVLAAPRGTLTPRLWSLGLQRAKGRLVRISIGCFVPATGWRDALVSALEDADVAGGPMEPAPVLRWRDLAIFFQRYRAFRPPFERHPVADVPADHSGYRRSVLDQTAQLWRAEFWERDVNAVLHSGGKRLVLDPAFRARYVGGESALQFIAHRFRHAIQFGRARIAGRGRARRALYIALFLLPGLVFLAKITRESLSIRGSARRFVPAFGWLVCFVAAWSLGEWVGAILGPPRPRETAGETAG